MWKINLLLVSLILIVAAVGCKSVKSVLPGEATRNSAPMVDFNSPAKPLDVTVTLDKKQAATGKITKAGGSVSLSTADGSKFTLDVPMNALDTETAITLTAVKSLDGAPLDNNTPTAVQLEPSGLFFKEMATLTIIPAKEIPIKQQLIFGYEGAGKDYHLALVDPKSREVKIKLMQFSGAGVGTASDAAWAANLLIQSEAAATRLTQKAGELIQAERIRQLLGDESMSEDFSAQLVLLMGQYEDQVVRKEEAAAELDCKHAERAVQRLLVVERQRQLLGFPNTSNFVERAAKLAKIYEGCPKNYRVDGDSAGAHFSGDICGLDKPFELTVKAPDGVWPMRFTPTGNGGGTMEGGFTRPYLTLQGSGPYTITVAADGTGTLQWSFTSTGSSPAGSMTNTKVMTVPLHPAPEGSCN